MIQVESTTGAAGLQSTNEGSLMMVGLQVIICHHICWHKAGYSFDVNLIVAALLVKAAFLFVFTCDKLQKDRQVVPGCCL